MTNPAPCVEKLRTALECLDKVVENREASGVPLGKLQRASAHIQMGLDLLDQDEAADA